MTMIWSLTASASAWRIGFSNDLWFLEGPTDHGLAAGAGLDGLEVTAATSSCRDSDSAGP